MISEARRRARAKVAFILLLVYPPLAPVGWVWQSGDLRPAYARSWLFWVGIALNVGSALPLLGVVVGDAVGEAVNPSSNPVGLGLLWLAGTVLGTIAMTAGVLLRWRELEPRH